MCVRTTEIFVSAFGAEAGNMALKTMSTGGVYLGGGIPAKMLNEERRAMFIQSFNEKGAPFTGDANDAGKNHFERSSRPSWCRPLRLGSRKRVSGFLTGPGSKGLPSDAAGQSAHPSGCLLNQALE